MSTSTPLEWHDRRDPRRVCSKTRGRRRLLAFPSLHADEARKVLLLAYAARCSHTLGTQLHSIVACVCGAWRRIRHQAKFALGNRACVARGAQARRNPSQRSGRQTL